MTEEHVDDLGRWTSYWDDGSLVIVDVRNPSAWIRSDVTIALEGPDRNVRSDSLSPP